MWRRLRLLVRRLKGEFDVDTYHPEDMPSAIFFDLFC